MFCPNCGKAVQEESVFCSACGTKIEVLAGGNQDAKVETPSPAPVTVPASNPIPAVSKASAEEKITRYANNRTIRIIVAACLVACILFLPFVSVWLYSLNGIDIISLVVNHGGEMIDSADVSQIPAGVAIGLCAAAAGMVLFVILAVCNLIGAVKNKRSLERKSALIGIISGVLLFIGLHLVLSAIKDKFLSYGSGFYGESLSATLSMLSPFKILSTGYWGTMILYIVSYILNKKRTDD